MADSLRLSRKQLAAFLPDPESIKQFEKLFSTVEAIAPDFVNEVFTLAGNADAKANQSIDMVIQAIQEAALNFNGDAKAQVALSLINQFLQDISSVNGDNGIHEVSKRIEGTEVVPPISWEETRSAKSMRVLTWLSM